LLRYAQREGLRWREDSTNADDRYLRNYIRHHILPRFADTDREALLQVVRRATELNGAIDQQMANFLHIQPKRDELDRYSFVMLPHVVAREVMAEWLLRNAGAELSKAMLERLVIAAKTGHSGTQVDINKQYWLEISRTLLALKLRER